MFITINKIDIHNGILNKGNNRMSSIQSLFYKTIKQNTPIWVINIYFNIYIL